MDWFFGLVLFTNTKRNNWTMVLPGSPFHLRSSDFDGYQDRCCWQHLGRIGPNSKKFYFLTIRLRRQLSYDSLFMAFMALRHECVRGGIHDKFLAEFVPVQFHLKHGILGNVTSPGRKNASTQPFLQIARTSPWEEATSPTLSHVEHLVAVMVEKYNVPSPPQK